MRKPLTPEQKEKIRLYNIEYRKKITPEQKEKRKLYLIEYNKNNKDIIKDKRDENKEKNKEYKEKNKDKIKETKAKYRKENKVKLSEDFKKYYEKNKETLIKKKVDYINNKLKTDSFFKFKFYIRASILKSFTENGYTKKSKTHEILGCSFEEFKAYLESKFEPWMTWENKGLYNGNLNYGWDIDHIVPLSSATTEDDVIRLNHYTNLQPLCSYYNRYIKRDNI